MSLLYRNWLIMNSLLKALYDISTISFCVLLWGKPANAAVIYDLDFLGTQISLFLLDKVGGKCESRESL